MRLFTMGDLKEFVDWVERRYDVDDLSSAVAMWLSSETPGTLVGEGETVCKVSLTPEGGGFRASHPSGLSCWARERSEAVLAVMRAQQGGEPAVHRLPREIEVDHEVYVRKED